MMAVRSAAEKTFRLRDETGLADTFLPDDEHYAPSPCGEVGEVLREKPELGRAADERDACDTPRTRPASRAALARADELEDRHLGGLALEAHAAEQLVLEGILRLAVGLRSDVDRVPRRFRLQARRNVHRVAEHVELADHSTANVAGHHAPGIDADDQIEYGGDVEPAAVFPELLAHLERGPGRRAGGVGRRNRIAEHDHDTVAKILIDGSAMTPSDPVENLQCPRDREIGAFGADLLRQFGEADDVGEHHRRPRHLAPWFHGVLVLDGAHAAAHCSLVSGSHLTYPSQ